MHEVGIIQSMLDLAIQTAQQNKASRIHQIRLRVGVMSGVVADALDFAFEVVRQGTMAAEARLDVETVPMTCWCAKCQREFQPGDFPCECPQCHELSAELRHGRELELASLEIS
jgi:hydrogenase nickel incorporation protein HypA/HybF